jgi:hypothetical protein
MNEMFESCLILLILSELFFSVFLCSVSSVSLW